MGKQRQSWSVEEKLAIVLAVLGERQSVAEIGRQRGVNENQIYRWKERFLEAGRQGLNGAKAQTADQRLEAESNQMKKWRGEKALEFQEQYAARAGIESTHEQAIHRCGLRRSRYIGLAKTHLQHVITAVAVNLVRLEEWWNGIPLAPPRRSRFAVLRPLAVSA